MDLKNINISMEEIKRDEKRELFVYTPPVGMEVKVVINELHYI